MTQDSEELPEPLKAAFPGLAHLAKGEADAVVRDVGKEVSAALRPVAFAWMIIAGTVFMVCFMAASTTGIYSFGVIAVLVMIYVAVHLLRKWRSALRLELWRRYGQASQNVQQDASAA